jgi:hypothetical protein
MMTPGELALHLRAQVIPCFDVARRAQEREVVRGAGVVVFRVRGHARWAVPIYDELKLDVALALVDVDRILRRALLYLLVACEV